ncbi:CHAP domain-containing protein [Staphylococcus kloosii]|jgi:surface antigen|uniref:CHAP domain-containing protein n=1 Tax=Staphylococcus kloosii TaxID=29384 RepID=A0A151A1N7_9STAP|nr:CHAP domain-containing protein [Staphylococcus kloosii]KYH13289.1 CHAP domain-containing protein [Staphylococcus kloosii]MBF7021407.1 CHAP domain-containing protein [Staphylococcus kloosii]MBF7030684.1 CHAP domain-containing protein [Staphylococcus kloosii]MCD8879943.1 CHAP domain-containing protein [Staphylococcus kloosii]PTJ80358.1 CHAP domain-containing protein [Staphylococcus kloosii]
MKKIATATIATAGIATVAFAHHDAHAAENNNGGYNPNDPTSYSYTYTIDQQGNYHYDWQGNWNPSQANHTNNSNVNYSNNAGSTANATQSYTANNNTTGGRGAVSNSTSNHNIKVTTQTAPSSSANSIASTSGSSNNLYTSGQCTYYVYDKVGGKIGSTWGDARNWASAAASSGYTVNNTPKAGSILQSSAGAYGHVAYVESVGSNGSVKVSEMNYGHGAGVVSTRTISASEASSYNYIH